MQDCSNAVITHDSSAINTESPQQNLSSNVNDLPLKTKENESIGHNICKTQTSKKQTDTLDSSFVKRWADVEDDDIYDIDETVQSKINIIESNASGNTFQTKKVSGVFSPLSNNKYRNSPQQRSPNKYWKSSSSNNFQYKDHSYKDDRNSLDEIWNRKKAKELKPKFKSETCLAFNENLMTPQIKQHSCRTLQNSSETLSPTSRRSDTMTSPKTYKAQKFVTTRKPIQCEIPQNLESTNVTTIFPDNVNSSNANKSTSFRKPHRYVALEGLIAQLNDTKIDNLSTIDSGRNVSIFGTGKPRDEPQQAYALSAKDSKSEKLINAQNTTA